MKQIKLIQYLVKIFILIPVFSSSLGFSSERPVLSFSKEIEVSKKVKIHLADVVSIKNPSYEIINAIKNIVFLEWDLSNSSEKEISSFEIGKILKKIADKNPEIKLLNPIYKIPNTVRFRAVSQGLISKDEIQNRLDQLFKIQCSQCEFQYTLKNEINVNQSLWSIDYSNIELKNNILLPVVQGEYKSFRWLTVGVSIQAPTVVAVKNLPMGHRISDKDFQLEVREIRNLGERIKNLDDFIGSKLVRPMRVGEILVEKILRRDPLTKRGSIVKVLLGNEAYELQSQFIAQEEGFKNDTIKIKNPENGKILSATIIDQDVVRVRE